MKKTIVIGLILFAVLCAVMHSGCKKKGKVVRKTDDIGVSLDWAVAKDVVAAEVSLVANLVLTNCHATNVFKDNDVDGPDVSVNVRLSMGQTIYNWDCPCHTLGDNEGLIDDGNCYHMMKVLRLINDCDAAVVKKIYLTGTDCPGVSIVGLQTIMLPWIELENKAGIEMAQVMCHEIGHCALGFAYGIKDHQYHVLKWGRVMYPYMALKGSMIVDNCPQNGNEKAAFEKWANAPSIPIWWDGSVCGTD